MSTKTVPVLDALAKVAGEVKKEIAEFKRTNVSEVEKDGKTVKVVAPVPEQFVDASVKFHLNAASADVGAALAATVKDML